VIHADTALYPFTHQLAIPAAGVQLIGGSGPNTGVWVGDFTTLHLYLRPLAGTACVVTIRWFDTQDYNLQTPFNIRTLYVGGTSTLAFNLPVIAPLVSVTIGAAVNTAVDCQARLSNQSGLPLADFRPPPGVSGLLGSGVGSPPSGINVPGTSTNTTETNATFAGAAHLWLDLEPSTYAQVQSFDHLGALLGIIAMVRNDTTVETEPQFDLALPPTRIKVVLGNLSAGSLPMFANLVPY
jgi:hypothetical protein